MPIQPVHRSSSAERHRQNSSGSGGHQSTVLRTPLGQGTQRHFCSRLPTCGSEARGSSHSGAIGPHEAGRAASSLSQDNRGRRLSPTMFTFLKLWQAAPNLPLLPQMEGQVTCNVTGPSRKPFLEKCEVSQRHLIIPNTAYMTNDCRQPIKEKAFLWAEALTCKFSLEPKRTVTRATGATSGSPSHGAPGLAGGPDSPWLYDSEGSTSGPGALFASAALVLADTPASPASSVHPWVPAA